MPQASKRRLGAARLAFRDQSNTLDSFSLHRYAIGVQDYPLVTALESTALRERESLCSSKMSAMTAKRQEVVGKDQDGRDVYADKSVVVPGSLRPDGTRRKDLRVRAEQRPDGSWRSFVPQDEVKKYEVRARRRAAPSGSRPAPRA